ncbi:bystin-like protein [Perilla frutescens var. hirtella]|uniref:Bystin-like protein n=1 Tax=Perilla frutescens var. hirtella TaxID=608512 RepID=A0AAD4JIG2_PERFH|nr:bystin-like protein [Perilla frutescens var. hirtella]
MASLIPGGIYVMQGGSAAQQIPSLQFWEEVLYLTEPDKCSSNAMYEATRIFVSNMGVKKEERFLKIVLLPRVREDIRKNQILHPALYLSLKKALYKPVAFNKGIIFPLCEVSFRYIDYLLVRIPSFNIEVE